MNFLKKSLSIILSVAIMMTLFVCLGSVSVTAVTQPFDKTASLEGITTTSNMKRGSHIYDNVTYADSVLNVPVPNDKHVALSAGSSQNIYAYLSAIPASNKPQQSSSDFTRAIWVKYKVKSIGEGGYAQVGIGYTSTYSNSWTATTVVGVGQKITVAGDTEYSFAASIPCNGNQEYRLVFSGSGGVEYEITSIIWASKESLKYGVVRYHIGDNFMYPVFCYNQAQQTSGFESLGASVDSVCCWLDADAEVVSGNLQYNTANLSSSSDIDVYAQIDHTYDNACDTDCNICSAEREITHTYDNDCDAVCNVCSAEREASDHVYSYDCDTTCNVCNAARSASHKDEDLDNKCDYCSTAIGGEASFTNAVELQDVINTDYSMERSSHIFESVNYDEESGVLKVPVTDSVHKDLKEGNTSDYKAFLTAVPYSSKPLQSSAGYTRAIQITYKVTSIGEGGYAQVGIGYTSTINDNFSNTTVVGVDNKITVDGDTEYTFAASIPCNGDQEYRFIFSGSGGVDYEITSIKWASKQSLKYAVVRYRIGESFTYPVFCYNRAQRFDALDSSVNAVSVWYDEDGNALETTKRLITPSTNLTSSGDIDIYDHAHTYDNACDSTCNLCSYTRSVAGHSYDNDCDTECNTCGTEREVSHTYDNDCDAECNDCGTTREVGDHEYDNACDTDCNVCGAIREVGDHEYDNACDTACNICSATRSVEAHKDEDLDNKCDTCSKILGYKVDFNTTVSLEAITTTSNMERGSYIYENTVYNGDTETLTVTVSDDYHKELKNNNYIKAYLSAIPDTTNNRPLRDLAGTTAILITYKVKSIGEGGYAQVGIGYTETAANNYSQTQIVDVDKKITKAGDTEYTFAASIKATDTADEYRFVFSGSAGVVYEITSIKYANKSNSVKYGVVRYHIGENFTYPVFCNNYAQKFSGLTDAWGASVDTVSVWYDEDGNPLEKTDRLISSTYTDVDLYDTVIAQIVVSQDFEAVETTDTLSDIGISANDSKKGYAWSVVSETTDSVTNNYLQRKATSDITNTYYTWGFSFNSTKLVAGRTYKVSFKAKANADITLDYGVLTAASYYSCNSSDDIYTVDHNKVSLTADVWKETYAYFTAKSFDSGTNAMIQILDTSIGTTTVVSFDDIVIEEAFGVSFNEYGNKYSAPYILAENDSLVIPGDPERAGYIFNGWYVDDALLTSETEVANFVSAKASWEEATLELSLDEVTTGETALMKITGANLYPIKFVLKTDGDVTVTLFTASADNSSIAKNVVWKRTFSADGVVAALINPDITKADGVTGNMLYIDVTAADGVTASVTSLSIDETIDTRTSVDDVNGDGEFNICDLVLLDVMASNVSEASWVGDVNDNGMIGDADDVDYNRNGILGIDRISETYGDRKLVWSDEFDELDTSVWAYSWYTDRTNNRNNVSVSDGKLNFKVTKADGINLETAPRLVTDGNMSYMYGYLEIRAKMSCTPYQWASFWLSGEDVDDNDIHGELDIFETQSSATGIKPNVHAWSEEGTNLANYGSGEGNITGYTYSDDFNTSEYHTYGFEWDKNYLTFYVDGTQYEQLTISDLEKLEYDDIYPFKNIFNDYYSIRLSQTFYDALKYDNAMPEFSVDYVRLYQGDGETYKLNGEVQSN